MRNVITDYQGRLNSNLVITDKDTSIEPKNTTTYSKFMYIFFTHVLLFQVLRIHQA